MIGIVVEADDLPKVAERLWHMADTPYCERKTGESAAKVKTLKRVGRLRNDLPPRTRVGILAEEEPFTDRSMTNSLT